MRRRPPRGCRRRRQGVRSRLRSSGRCPDRLPQPELLVRPAEVDDLLGSPVARKPRFLTKAERPEDREIEGERPLDVANREVDVMDRAGRHGQAPRLKWAADSRISGSSIHRIVLLEALLTLASDEAIVTLTAAAPHYAPAQALQPSSVMGEPSGGDLTLRAAVPSPSAAEEGQGKGNRDQARGGEEVIRMPVATASG